MKIKRSDTIKETYVTFLLDDSASMQSVREATISGFNEQLQHVQAMENPEHKVFLTVIKFSTPDKIATLRYRVPAKAVSPIELPEYAANGGGTALLDAMKEAIYQTDTRNLDYEQNAALVVFMTDGLENSSRGTSRELIKELIQSRESKGNWTFTYMGVGDPEMITRDYGIAKGNVARFQTGVVGAAMNAHTHSHSLDSYSVMRSSGGTQVCNFYDPDEALKTPASK
jgi:uncharacterized protein YegL